MRQKRAKTYKRVMALYVQTFSFRSPFQILVSNDLIMETNRDSDLYKQLGACVQGEVKPMITQCCMEALYKLGKPHQALVDIAKGFERRRCNHREPIEPDQCLIDVVGQTNKHRYIVAAQSSTLRTTLNTIPGLPIIHFNPRGVLVLSPPSQATLKHKVQAEEARRLEGAELLKDVKDGSNVVGSSSSSSALTPVGKPQRSRGVKAPNPLSMRKKKVDKVPSGGEGKKVDGGEGKKVDSEERKKRSRENEDEEGEKDAEGKDKEDSGPVGERKKKKRKRKTKSAVKDAIAELDAEAKEARSTAAAPGELGDGSSDGDGDSD
ncbi:Fcf1-domain-containing protein [Naematelia encephala]|uniref:U three protein 23 n=1 Tax=Naematelia encephala TaxID=71784 RepID=A0A1Y2AFC9_9TREE|nr:Fcf1-domain-containing protein [Naematelia encephala]